MRLGARLKKLEIAGQEDLTDLRKLTDEELAARMRDCVKALDIDWDELISDPRGTVQRRFQDVSDDDGVIAGFLDAIDQVGVNSLPEFGLR